MAEDSKNDGQIYSRLSHVEAVQAVQGTEIINIKEITIQNSNTLNDVRSMLGDMKAKMATATAPKADWVPIAGLGLSFIASIFATIFIMIQFVTNPIDINLGKEVSLRESREELYRDTLETVVAKQSVAISELAARMSNRDDFLFEQVRIVWDEGKENRDQAREDLKEHKTDYNERIGFLEQRLYDNHVGDLGK